MGRRSVRSYVRDFFANWRTSEEHLGRKAVLAIRNRLRATGHGFTGKGFCCGHHGEPGC
jgi:hypothetical protein